MRTKMFIAVFFGLCSLCGSYGQEPDITAESAEISTESYSDAFQEHFFEALKQKGIENYEKAIAELQECEKLEPDNDVVDYELGRNYLALKQYGQAEAYLLKAVEKNPEIWYLDALFSVYEKQNDTKRAIEVGQKLVEANGKYKENLVRIYINTGKYEQALALIDELNAERGKSEERRRQKVWIEAQMRLQKEPGTSPSTSSGTETKETPENSGEKNELEEVYRKIENYKRLFNHREVLLIAEDALEIYPAQPRLYYNKAHALNRLKKHREAITDLQNALDYLVDDERLENDIYREFVIAYNSLGNNKKADEYARKIKNNP